MDKMDFFSDEDQIDYDDVLEHQEAQKQIFKIVCCAIEDCEFLDNLTFQEMQFYVITKKWWFGHNEFKALTDKQKKVVFLYFVQNFSVQEIANHLTTDKSSIYKILKRAFKKSKALANSVNIK